MYSSSGKISYKTKYYKKREIQQISTKITQHNI